MTDLEHTLLKELDQTWKLLRDCDEEKETLRVRITALLAELTALKLEES